MAQALSNFELQEKIQSIETALLESSPALPTILRDILKILKADADLVTVLTEEECSLLVKGLEKQTKTEIASKIAKSKPKKALSKMSLDDL